MRKETELVNVCKELVALKEQGNASAISRPEYRVKKQELFNRLKELVRG